ncbi:hypothetical protein E6O75_ATG00931 [Venturia nashicola]|uniref:small monomeric GTPase n=1 Tax=Venturia nashicola TaxID=86259 RepID=A0A4Z1PAM9_9PEZI|nr:hypothetical protein E6O75_ATG00931 [Venturia nashicola]
MQPFVPPDIQQNARKHLSYTLLIVGAQGVGKYCLHHQFVYACFPSIRDPFFDSETPQMLWKSDSNDKFAFQVQPKRMDISRPENVPQSQHLYPATRLPVDLYRFTDADGMMLVFNIDSRSSFDALTQFIDARNQDIKSKTVEPKVLCLVGNKLDKSRDKRKILCLEGEALASKLGCAYIECSAKEQKGLDKLKSVLSKAMETQRSQLQYVQQQRERAAQGSRVLKQKNSFIRRLSSTRSDTPRLKKPDESNSGQQMARDQKTRNGVVISSSGRYKGGMLSTSLLPEDRIEEEDEETESDEISRSSSQQSSYTSTSSKQSSITITPPNNAGCVRPPYGQRLTMQKLPPATMISLTPVSEQPPGMVGSLSDLAFFPSAGLQEKELDGLGITTSTNDSNTGNLLQRQSSSKEEGQPDCVPIPSPESSPVNSRGLSPQYIFNTQSSSQSRATSPEVVDDVQTATVQNLIQPAKPFQLLQLEFSQPMSPTIDEKRKLDEERAQLEEEKEKLRQEMQELQERQARLEDRRRENIERRKIEEERKKIVEERKRIEEERQNLKEAKRKIEEEEEEEQWNCPQSFLPDEPQADHTSSPTLNEKFGGGFPEIGAQDDTKNEESRRYHQEQIQQERQQDLHLKTSVSSLSPTYSVPQDDLPVQKPVKPSEDFHHPLRGTWNASPTSPQKEPKILQRRHSLLTTRSASQSEFATDKSKAPGSPPTSPEISQTFRRFLGKKNSKKQPASTDQRETMTFFRDELGIATLPMPIKEPQQRRPKSQCPPPGTKIENEETLTRRVNVAAEEKPKAPFPGQYISLF